MDSTPPAADAAPVVPPPRRRGLGWVLPSARRLIAWLFAARMVLAVAILLGASLAWTRSPDVSFIVTISVLLAFTVTAYGWWAVWIKNREPGPVFLAGPGAGGPRARHHARPLHGRRRSPLSGALRAGARGLRAAAAALGRDPACPSLASALYFGAGVCSGAARSASRSGRRSWCSTWSSRIVAVLGHRLREAGVEQDTLATELERVRLEADDILRNIRSGVLTVDGFGRLAFINPTAERLLDLDGETLIGLPVLDQLKTPVSGALGRRRGRHPERAARSAGARASCVRGDGAIVPDRPQHHHLPPGGAGGARRSPRIFTDISDLQAAAGAPPAGRAAGGGGGAERLAGPRDPEPARLDPELGGAARPLEPAPTRTSGSWPG